MDQQTPETQAEPILLTMPELQNRLKDANQLLNTPQGRPKVLEALYISLQ